MDRPNVLVAYLLQRENRTTMIHGHIRYQLRIDYTCCLVIQGGMCRPYRPAAGRYSSHPVRLMGKFLAHCRRVAVGRTNVISTVRSSRRHRITYAVILTSSPRHVCPPSFPSSAVSPRMTTEGLTSRLHGERGGRVVVGMRGEVCTSRACGGWDAVR